MTTDFDTNAHISSDTEAEILRRFGERMRLRSCQAGPETAPMPEWFQPLGYDQTVFDTRREAK